MNVEQMTNEELAEAITDIIAMTDDEELLDEAARRLRNSIPKPVVELYEYDSSWYVRINGSDVLADNPLNYYKAQLWFEAVKQALGMEGGGDAD